MSLGTGQVADMRFIAVHPKLVLLQRPPEVRAAIHEVLLAPFADHSSLHRGGPGSDKAGQIWRNADASLKLFFGANKILLANIENAKVIQRFSIVGRSSIAFSDKLTPVRVDPVARRASRSCN